MKPKKNLSSKEQVFSVSIINYLTGYVTLKKTTK